MTSRKRAGKKIESHRISPDARMIPTFAAEKVLHGQRTEPLKSTVLIPHDGPSRELLAFASSIGAPMNGGGSEGLVCTSGDTNMRCAAQLVDEPMEVRELWLEIPKVAEARFQIPLPCGTRNPVKVDVDEAGEIVKKTQVSFYVGGDKPFVRQMLSSFLPGPDVPAGAALRFHLVIRPVVRISRIEKFWVELAFPNGTPQFKPICPNSRVYPRIPVAIYLVP